MLVGIYCAFANTLPLFLCYTLSALVHEYGHYIVAKKYGYKMLKVRLMPYGAELCGEEDEFIFNHEIVIALSGPITSIIFSGLLVMSWWLVPNIYNYTIELCMASFVCGIFNLLPIYPLDGGRVLVAKLSKQKTRKSALKWAKYTTRAFAVCLAFMFVFSCFYAVNISFGIMAIMLFSSTFSSGSSQSYKRLLVNGGKNRHLCSGLEVVELVVGQNIPIYKIYPKLKEQKYYKFKVVNANLTTVFECDEKIFYNLTPEQFKLTFLEIKKINKLIK